MARLTKEEKRVFDPALLIRSQKREASIIKDLMIGAEPYTDRPLTPKEVEEKQKNQPGTSPYLPGKSPIPSKGLAHHTGGKHFTEPSMDELIQGLINGDVPRGTLGDEETENRMIQEYLNKQSLKIGWVKNVGDPLTPQEVGDGLKIIDSTETNPLKKRLRLDRMMKNNPLAKSPSQQNATNMRELIKKLTKEGKHIEAQALYREQFPRA